MLQVVARTLKPIVRPLIQKWRHWRKRFYFLTFLPSTAIRLMLLKRKLGKSRRGEFVEFPVSDRVRPALRAKTHDIDIFEQIFVLRDCRVKLQSEPQFIVDAGAHIGCSALFFASSFPRANITAIEADLGNYQWLLRNTRDHQRIRAIHAAVWHRPEAVASQTRRMTLGAFESNLRTGNARQSEG
jgi:hypothetical protein